MLLRSPQLLKLPKLPAIVLALGILLTVGCGTVKQQKATDQLLVSDAVDRTLSRVSFVSLGGSQVFIDTQFIRSIRSSGCVDSNYVLSCLRELAIRDGCILKESRGEAEYVVEVRMGALGMDNHVINYGIPGNSAVNQTASLLANAPIPAIPEISLAKKDERRAAVKISLFAYDRVSGEPVWQTGTMTGQSNAKSTWVLGAGPFQEGEIYNESTLRTSPVDVQFVENAIVQKVNRFQRLKNGNSSVATVSHEEPVKADRFSSTALERERKMAALQPQRLPKVVIETEHEPAKTDAPAAKR